MSLLEIMENRFNYIKKDSQINVLQFELESNNKECDFSNVESKLGIRLSDGIKEIYSKYRRVKM